MYLQIMHNISAAGYELLVDDIDRHLSDVYTICSAICCYCCRCCCYCCRCCCCCSCCRCCCCLLPKLPPGTGTCDIPATAAAAFAAAACCRNCHLVQVRATSLLLQLLLLLLLGAENAYLLPGQETPVLPPERSTSSKPFL